MRWLPIGSVVVVAAAALQTANRRPPPRNTHDGPNAPKNTFEGAEEETRPALFDPRAAFSFLERPGAAEAAQIIEERAHCAAP